MVDLIFWLVLVGLVVWRRLLGQKWPKMIEFLAEPNLAVFGGFGRLAAIFWRKLPIFGQVNFAVKMTAKLAA